LAAQFVDFVRLGLSAIMVSSPLFAGAARWVTLTGKSSCRVQGLTLFGIFLRGLDGLVVSGRSSDSGFVGGRQLTAERAAGASR
jgi:hypothetical protein